MQFQSTSREVTVCCVWVHVTGPSKATSSDLWHMAWQLGTSRIIMLANLTEDGRVGVVYFCTCMHADVHT